MRFMRALFDVSFTEFITPTVAGIILILCYGVEGLLALSVVITSLRKGLGARWETGAMMRPWQRWKLPIS